MRCAIFMSAWLLASVSGHPINTSIWPGTTGMLFVLALSLGIWDLLD